MKGRPTTLERAFELAASGRFATIAELRRELSAEGFLDARMHTDGRALQRQLTELMRGPARGADRPLLGGEPDALS